MNLPDTENAHYHYAFKKGYRMAMDGKPLSQMPSSIRRDSTLREYFQQGWDQLHEELANSEQADAKAPWRNRFAWFMMMILAGIGTATLMVTQINDQNIAQQAKIDSVASQTARPGKNPDNPPVKTASIQSDIDALGLIQDAPDTVTQNQPTIASQKRSVSTTDRPLNDLSLLSSQARQDLTQMHQETFKSQTQNRITLAPIQDSHIHINEAVLAENITKSKPVHPLQNPIPKYIRKAFFFTQVTHAPNQTIYHRWIYQDQIMATIPLKITSENFRTWSSKRLSSAWAGQWHIEILDNQKNVIYRHSFNYIK